MLATAAELKGQVWFWAARQAIAPVGFPFGVGVMRPPHAAAESPGCAQASPDRHRQCKAPVRSPAASGRPPLPGKMSPLSIANPGA